MGGRHARPPAALLILAALAAALALASLGSGGPAAPSANVAPLAEACSAVGGAVEPPPSPAMREAFVDPGGADAVRLLLDRTVVRPGEGLTLAPVNYSDSEIHYGLHAGVEDPATGEPLPGPGGGLVLALGINADAGDVGACTSVTIPNSAPPGDYLAVLFGVAGDDFPETDIKAPFTISGAPQHDVAMMPAGVIAPKDTARTYPRRVIRAAETRVTDVLEAEPFAGSWSVGDDLTGTSISVDVPELSREAYREILRVSDVPVKFTIASGTDGSSSP